jgi:hypothetical protein
MEGKEKEMYCRIQGYQLDVHSIDKTTGQYWVTSGDCEAYQALKLNCFDRGCYDGCFFKSDIDCIWTEQNHQVVDVLKGGLRVGEKDYEQRQKLELRHRRFFALYNGHKYLNIQGVNSKTFLGHFSSSLTRGAIFTASGLVPNMGITFNLLILSLHLRVFQCI